MENNVFEEPVPIIVGLGFPTKVETVAETYALLSEWPYERRDRTHGVALKSCKAALDGLIDAETARGAFLLFARKNGILMPDPSPVIAAQAMESRDPQLSA